MAIVMFTEPRRTLLFVCCPLTPPGRRCTLDEMGDPTWTSELEVAPRMDREHEAQIDLIRALERAVESRAPRDRIAALLEELADTTDVHFMSEQIEMREHAYPHYASHVREHERLLEEVKGFRARYDAADGGELDAQLVRDLQRWLRNHIRGMDRRFGEYLAQQGTGSSGTKPNGAND